MRLIHWAAEGRLWPRPAAGVALLAGALAGVAAALHLPPAERGALASHVLAYAAARGQGRGSVFGPALAGWLRVAAPVWVAGMWTGAGLALVLGALLLHGFSLGFSLCVAAAGGWSGLGAGLAAVLPGNLLALPALWWLGARALDLAASRRGGARGVPAPYLQVGAAVLLLVTCSSLAEAALAPWLLRWAG